MSRRVNMSQSLLFACLFLFVGCAGPVSNFAEDEPGDEAGVNAPNLFYPHTANWDSPTEHGAIALDQEYRELCITCHEFRQDAPQCTNCHTFPHADNWADPANHSVAFLSSASAQKECQSCHGVDYLRDLNGKSCYSCHTFPHGSGFSHSHGAELSVNANVQLEDCQKCHGQDFKEEKNGKTCFSCHTTFPHPENWSTTHPAVIDESLQGSIEDCKMCHGQDLTVEKEGQACFSCHNYPHAEDWDDPTNHGTAYLADSQDCQECHGEDFSEDKKGTTCFSCHAGFPHTEDWEDTHPGVVNGVLGGDIEGCKDCHGQDFKEEKNGQTCFSCHIFPHDENWEPYGGGHGQMVQVTLGGDLQECQDCHGDLLTENKNGQNCFNCHASFPHDYVWENLEDHADYVMDLMSTENCKQCHGDDYNGIERDFDEGGTLIRQTPSCKECHYTVECTACHDIHSGDIKARGRFLEDSELIFM